uniref:c-Myc-binding protein n=1 Tax=Anopheles epiroticus TaxID=199890 RepID=A0A182NZL7_9DIPT
MGNYKPIDVSKEEFRKYLDRQGVLDAITKVLVKCNQERPDNALTFLLENMTEKHSPLKEQLQAAQEEIARLKAELSALKVGNEEVKVEKLPAVNGTPEDKSVLSEEEIDNASPSDADAKGNADKILTPGGGSAVKENDATTTTLQKDSKVTEEGGTTDGVPKEASSPAAKSSSELSDATAPTGSSPAATGNVEAPDVKKDQNTTPTTTTTEIK